MLVAAFVIDQDEAGLTFSANVSEHIMATSVNVDVALTLEQMVMRDTFEARFFIGGVFGAGSDVLFSGIDSLGKHFGLLGDNEG